MEVGRQHHAQQHLSTQIITALSFSACVEDVMHFPHVSFHICAVKSASTHDVSHEHWRHSLWWKICQTDTRGRAKVLNISLHRGPFCAVASMLASVDCRWQGNWISIYTTVAWVWLSVILFKLHANTFLCTVSFESLCVALILPPSHCACCKCTKITNWGRARFTLGQIRAQTHL